MKESFRQFPQALQKQILVWTAVGCILLAVLVLIWVYHGGLELMVPCAVFSAVFFLNALELYGRCSERGYVVIIGTCTQVDRTGFRRRVKDIYVQEDQYAIRIVRPAWGTRPINAGDRVRIYLAGHTPVYEMDGCKVICNTLAVEKIH